MADPTRFGEIIGANGSPPWDEGLLANVRALEARLELARSEYAQLLLENRKLRRQLREARHRLELWKERQDSWRREREALLRRP